MKFTLDNGTAEFRITAYENGRIGINGEWVTQSMIVSPNHISEWPVNSLDELEDSHLKALLAFDAEIVVLGTGLRQQFPKADTLKSLYESGTGVEIMDTAAACRTYNVLMSEDRSVVAALIIEA